MVREIHCEAVDLQCDGEEHVPDNHHRKYTLESGSVAAFLILYIVEKLWKLPTQANHAWEDSEEEVPVVMVVDQFHLIFGEGHHRADDWNERKAPHVLPWIGRRHIEPLEERAPPAELSPQNLASNLGPHEDQDEDMRHEEPFEDEFVLRALVVVCCDTLTMLVVGTIGASSTLTTR